MFIGHFGVGFGAKAYARRVSLGTLFLAAQFIDLLWPTLLLLGLEQVEIRPGHTRVTPLAFTHYPLSHSLAMVGVWAVLFGAVHYALKRSRRAAIVLALCVISHWALDLLVHSPDLPLYPGRSPHVGLGMWSSLAATLLFEGIIFTVGIALYLKETTAKNRNGVWGFWLLVGLLVVIYVANVLGPPPPSVTAIAWTGQSQWLLVALAYWVDRNREHRRTGTPHPAPHRSAKRKRARVGA
jgi:hypothetical protein